MPKKNLSVQLITNLNWWHSISIFVKGALDKETLSNAFFMFANKPLFAILLLFVLASSCKTPYANFANSAYHPDVWIKEEKREVLKVEPLEVKEITTSIFEEPVFTASIEEVPAYFPAIEEPSRSVIVPPTYQKVMEAAVEQIGPKPISKEQAKAKAQKKKRRKALWRKMGANLVTGLACLAIAIGLTILNLGSLAVIFAIGSIIFLYFAIRKIFKAKKKPINNPFKKKI